MAFVLVLSDSRRIALRFYLNQQMENFLHGHLMAFETFGGTPVCFCRRLYYLEKHPMPQTGSPTV